MTGAPVVIIYLVSMVKYKETEYRDKTVLNTGKYSADQQEILLKYIRSVRTAVWVKILPGRFLWQTPVRSRGRVLPWYKQNGVPVYRLAMYRMASVH